MLGASLFAISILDLICISLIRSSGEGNIISVKLYSLRIDFSRVDVPASGWPAKSTFLATALQEARHEIADIYDIYLWNYCNSTATYNETSIRQCSRRPNGFIFDFGRTWGLKVPPLAASPKTGKNFQQNKLQKLENGLWGDSMNEALKRYDIILL